MKAVTVPAFLKIFYPSLLWQMPAGQKKLYLTFDDGPHPEITPQVLDILEQHQALASFFCVGENVRKFPEVYARLIENGHAVGNHSMNHLNGWKTNLNQYYENVNECRNLVDSPLFRPPYGRITPSQIHTLKKEYTIVMWSVLSYDFDPEISKEQCLEFVTNNAEDGAVIVFHDSEKAASNLFYALPKVLKYYSELGYTFEKL
jgi:peptidoglycan/xylan/chitin deacetylase (PgdA/CDA1 family)